METELAWAAGFFDGEGSFSAWIRRKRSLGSIVVSMSLTQKDRRPLDRFQRAVNAGAIYFITPTARPERGGWWTWQLRSVRHMQPVVDSLWPYMSEPKQEQWLAQLEKVAQHKAGLTYGRGRNKRRLDSDGDVVPQSQTTAPNGTATIINNLEEVT